jgi:hypothetical protein
VWKARNLLQDEVLALLAGGCHFSNRPFSGYE